MNFKSRIQTILYLYLPDNWYNYLKLKFNKFQNKDKASVIYNLGNSTFNHNHNKILFSYDLSTVMVPSKDWGTLGHTHAPEFASILWNLTNSGFIVDVMHYLNTPQMICTDYDFIMGLGPSFRKASKVNPRAQRILYLTEKVPSFSNAKEIERIEYLQKRHGISIPMERKGVNYLDEDFINLKAIIGIGIEKDRQYLPKVPTWFITPTGILNYNFCLEDRNVNESKKHFLWFGSRGVVHKGLDLLYDVFEKHPELTLHVCGASENSLRLIAPFKPKNVFIHGFIKVQSDEFLSLANKCAFDLFPSCSEEVATSVLTCMNHGIIPIVTDECSIEAAGTVAGETLKDFTVETIDEAVTRWSNSENDFLFKQMQNTMEYARDNYKIEHFDNRMKKIINELKQIL